MAKPSARTSADASPEMQLTSFIDKFDPAVAKVIRGARKLLRKRLPTAVEQIYDNYNFLAIGFCSTERTSDCIVSLAAAAGGVSLSFYYGATLPDPAGILLGVGKQNRFVRLDTADALKEPEVAELITAAKEHPGRKPLKDVKLFKEDPVAVEKMGEEIKARYAKLFGV